MFQLWIILGFLTMKLALGAFDFGGKCFEVKDTSCSNITYWLYTSKQPEGQQIASNGKDGFDPNENKPLKVIIHGFGGNRDSTPNAEIRPELLRHSDIEVLSIDYECLVREPCYKESVHNIKLVGLCLGNFLNSRMDAQRGNTGNTHLIGHGLGAHVAAFAGQHLLKFGRPVQRISGLNPSKLLFQTSNLDDRLDASDALFVDVLHTDVFMTGFMQPIGHVDFFPNKGIVQPNCGPVSILKTHQCYHKRAAEYYAESIETTVGFWAFRCKDLYSFVSNECQPTQNVALLGYRTSSQARGSYFLATNEQPPYARGSDFNNLDRSVRGQTYLGDALFDKLEEMGGERIRGLVTKV